jgi:hypothetical protein
MPFLSIERIMSNLVEFYKVLQPEEISAYGVATLDGATNIAPPLQLPPTGSIKMQATAITISDRIPNFFNAAPYYSFDNTIIRVSTNTQAPYDIVLTRGLYSDVTQVAAAINAAITDNLMWWQTPSNPGLTMSANSIIDSITITIDSTKLNPAYGNSFRLDMRNTSTGTAIAYTLGFSETSANLVGLAGGVSIFNSDQQVHMDTQGVECDIQCSLIAMRRRNDTQVRTLAMVPFAGKNSASDNVWPSAGQISPQMVYEGSKQIKYMSVEVKTASGKPMLFMGGGLRIIISFQY